MARHIDRSITTAWLVAICVGLAIVPQALAEDPPKDEPKTSQTSSQATPVPGSLAAAASKIKLQTPEDGEGGGVVISDKNVKKAGAGAALSQGSGTSAPSAAPALGSTAGTSPVAASNANQIAEQLMAQKAKVDNMEAQLASYDEQLGAPPVDPHYADYRNSPQNRAPGVVDPAQGKRDAYAAELEKEKATLRELEKRARQAGVTIAKPEPEKK